MGAFFLFCGVLANGLASISIKIGATPPTVFNSTVFYRHIEELAANVGGHPLFHGFKFLYLSSFTPSPEYSAPCDDSRKYGSSVYIFALDFRGNRELQFNQD